MNYKGILLDLDDTLYDYENCHQAGMKKVLTYLEDNFSLPPKKIKTAFDSVRHQNHLVLHGTAAAHNRMLYFHLLTEELSLPLEAALELYRHYWDNFLAAMSLAQGSLEFLEKTREKDIKICLLTDLTAHIQHRKLNQLSLFKYIDCMVTSEEAGHEKPHPYIFMKALSKLQLTPGQVVMIGDNYQKDIIGALNMKIKPYWLNNKAVHQETCTEVTVFSNFSKLVELFYE